MAKLFGVKHAIWRKQLSAGQQGSISVEELYEGLDFAFTLNRDKFDELTRSLLTKTIAPIREG